MFGVVRGALRARRAQAATVLVLTGLAVAVAAAAPWYVRAAERSVAVADVDGARSSELVVRVSGRVEGSIAAGGSVRPGADVVAEVEEQAGALVDVPGAESTVSLRETGAIVSELARIGLRVAYRDDMCEHLEIEGSCPRAAGEVLLSRRTAQALQVKAGDKVDFVLSSQPPVAFTVAGTYQLADPLGQYWALTDFGGSAALDPGADGPGDPAFVSSDTVAALPIKEILADYHLRVPPGMFLDDLAGLRADLAPVGRDNGAWRVTTDAVTLANRIDRERDLVGLGVGVAAVQLLVLCWFGLFFAVRHTAEQRRPDIGLLKLRGAKRWRLWHLAIAQSAVPMLFGALVGAAAGLGVARLVAGDVKDTGSAAMLSGIAALAALFGAVLAAVAADASGMRAPVTDLLRHVPSRRRGWRAEVVDLVIVLVAAAGLYQSYATSASVDRDDTTGLALLAPALVAVLVALAAARLLTPLAGRVGRRALRSGRVPVALGATQLARRPGTHRVFALLVIAVALLGTAVGGWTAASDARVERARHELGADRVLTVQARSRAQLVAAVRAADPGGRQAMAVVRGANGPATVLLAVDSARFAAVADWQPLYGSPPLPELLHPAAPAPLSTKDGEVTLDVEAKLLPAPLAPLGPGDTGGAAGGSAVTDPLFVLLHLENASGDQLTARFGPVSGPRSSYTASLTGCGAGCRVVGLEPVTRNFVGRSVVPEPGTTVTVFGLAGAAGPVLPPATLADVSRWRAGVGADTVGPNLTMADGALTITAVRAAREADRATRVYAVDAPAPLPVVTTDNAPPPAAGDPRLPVFGGEDVPIRRVGVVGTLPTAGRFGYLMDLEYADRIAQNPGTGDVPQVWLTADAAPDIVDKLRAGGVTVISDETSAALTDRFGREAPPAALRFQLVAALAGLLLTAGAFIVVAAVERPERAAEFAALRAQGLPPRVVSRVAWGGYGGLALAAIALGIGASALAQAVTRRPIPLFVDGWDVLPVAVGPQFVPLGLALLGAVLIVGTAGAAAATLLVRAVDEESA
ncbi:FtsX-like permease family protein [Asanoa hainanensis]|uniref:FtsX-like permease family protein n=1 Tax=Asanoa hainanensis TaxID=560556 RepID=A0A239JQ07_9ACTN|nr:FtsX-like permease family protein [Asanoa hainanensis]SNT07927.1 FtsX-like permease family protein [Asanoa hainanensis]